MVRVRRQARPPSRRARPSRSRSGPPPAKLGAPRLFDVHPRRRLFRLLDGTQKRPLVWVSAPAGAGKTTLVASWLDARDPRSVWYHVDERDDDPASFFHDLALAVASRRRRRLPWPPPPDPAGLSAFSRRWFEAFFAALEPPCVLVLDDYHAVAPDSPLHELVRNGLAALPRDVRAVVVSRADPPPVLMRLLASGAMTVLRWPELRLSLADARGIARARGLPRDRDLPRLHAAADGWAAGLVLLLQQEQPVEPTTPMSTGLVFDYFAAELLERMDPAVRDFMVQTSVLPRMTERTVERLTGRRDARALLARLERGNCFLVRHGAGEGVFTYHPLFHACLRERAAALGDELTRLRRDAAQILLEEEEPEAAFQLSLEAGDHDACAGLVLQEAPALLADGRGRTLSTWLGGLPSAMCRSDPWLAYYTALCDLGRDPGTAADRLAHAFQLFRAAEDPAGAHLALASAVQAVVHEGRDFRPLGDWIAAAGDLPPPPRPDIAARVATGMLTAWTFWRGGGAESRAWAERASTLAAAADPGHRLATGGFLAIHEAFFGDPARVSAALDLLAPAARRGDSDPLARVTLAHAEALSAWAGARDDDCLAAVGACLELAAQTGVNVWNDQAGALGAAAALSAGRLDQAQRHLEGMAVSAGRGTRFAVGNYHFYAAWDALLRRDLPRARRSLELSCAAGDELGFPFARAQGRLASALLDAAEGRLAEAREHLAVAAILADSMCSRLVSYACDLVEADLALREGDAAAAEAPLRRGFALGRESGLYNMFWSLPEVTARLCTHALGHDIEPVYAAELVRRRRVAPGPSAAAVPGWPWELEIRALGGFDLRRAGEPLDTSRKAQRVPLRLLRAMVALGGRDVPGERLADAMWPDAEADAARRSFDTTLHRLRKLLGDPDLVQLRDGRLSLDPRRVWVDVWALEPLLAEIDRALARSGAAGGAGQRAGDPGDDARAPRLEGRLLDLYRGALLPGEDGAWILGTRERLRDRVLDRLRALGQERERRGELEAALELYRRALALDEVAEPLLLRLLITCERLGRRSEGLRAYQQARQALKATLGLEPSPALTAVYQRLRADPLGARSVSQE